MEEMDEDEVDVAGVGVLLLKPKQPDGANNDSNCANRLVR